MLFLKGLYNQEALIGGIHSCQTGNLLNGAHLAPGGEIRSGISCASLRARASLSPITVAGWIAIWRGAVINYLAVFPREGVAQLFSIIYDLTEQKVQFANDLCEIGGLTYEELAAVLEVSPAAIRSLLYRVRLQLRATVLAPSPVATSHVLKRNNDDDL